VLRENRSAEAPDCADDAHVPQEEPTERLKDTKTPKRTSGESLSRGSFASGGRSRFE